jgi:hypothetical protein
MFAEIIFWKIGRDYRRDYLLMFKYNSAPKLLRIKIINELKKNLMLSSELKGYEEHFKNGLNWKIF